MPEPSPLWRPDRYDRYLDWTLERGTTANGVFGAKLMWGYLGDFATLRVVPNPRVGRMSIGGRLAESSGGWIEYDIVNPESGAVQPKASFVVQIDAQRLGLRGLKLNLNSLGTPESRRAYRDLLVTYFRSHEARLDADLRTFDELTDGRGIMIYGQQEVVKDLVAAGELIVAQNPTVKAAWDLTVKAIAVRRGALSVMPALRR